MPKINFDDVPDAEDYTPVPKGRYLCRVAEVHEDVTQSGDEMWHLWLEIAQGDHAGRFLFDNMVFSEKALKRVKLICSRLGLDVSGEIDLVPEMITDHMCWVIADVEEYEDAAGQLKRRNFVPFAGYERYTESEKSQNDDDLPF